jgi:hypothetical protein
MKKLFKNPVFIIVFLTSLMGLPFIVFLLDKYLLHMSNPLLLLAEIGTIAFGITSAIIILLFFFK